MQFYWSKLVKIIKNYTRDDTTTEGKARIMQINNLDNLIQQLALKSTSFQTSNQHPFKQKNTRVREKKHNKSCTYAKNSVPLRVFWGGMDSF